MSDEFSSQLRALMLDARKHDWDYIRELCVKEAQKGRDHFDLSATTVPWQPTPEVLGRFLGLKVSLIPDINDNRKGCNIYRITW